MDLSTRRVHIAGSASRANDSWMAQVARDVTDDVDVFLRGKRYLIQDRYPLYTDEFLRILREAGVESVNLPPQSPNLNAQAEWIVRTIKPSCLERRILLGEASLRKAISELVAHYHLERNRQGLGNRLTSLRKWRCASRARAGAAAGWEEC
jgi:hypothetical protein